MILTMFILLMALSLLENQTLSIKVVREVMTLPSIKVVEHPDLFVESGNYSMDDFDYIIELRENENQEIEYDQMKQQTVKSKTR